MKSKLFIIAAVGTLMFSVPVMAQQPRQTSPASNDTTTQEAPVQPKTSTEEENVVTSSHGDLLFDGQVPQQRQLSTDNLTYGQNGLRNGEVHNGRRNAFYRNDVNASEWFFEGKAMLGDNVGGGVQCAFVPRHWGGYMSYLITSDADYYRYDWLTVGAVFRPMINPEVIDFQLYGGLAVGKGSGVEYGLRIAAADDSPFSWLSFTMGGIQTPDFSAVTFGFSVGLTGIICYPLFW